MYDGQDVGLSHLGILAVRAVQRLRGWPDAVAYQRALDVHTKKAL